MIIGVVGDVGTGKTLFLVDYAYRHPELPVFTNFRIKLPNCKLIDLEDFLLLKYDRAAIFLDEAYTELESRLSGRALNRYMSYVAFQSRKRGLRIFYTAQLFSSIDVRFRSMTNFVVQPQPVSDKGFRYSIGRAGEPPRAYYFVPMGRARKLFPLYDTLEIVEPIDIQELWFDIISRKPEKLNQFLDQLAKEYASDSAAQAASHKEVPRSISKPLILDWIVSKGYPKKAADYLYNRLKRKG